MDTIIPRPQQAEYAPYFQTYIDKVDSSNDLIKCLEEGRENFTAFLQSVPAEKLSYRYGEDKWTTAEVILHIIDTERIFAYRALRFSRNDKTALPGFDEKNYAPECNAAGRSIQSLTEEYTAVRQASLLLYKNMTEEMTTRTGISNGREISVRALGFITAGHELHHTTIIKERYLN